jgi:predicted enzyme related to lactoylglutathione lyase
MNKAAIPLEGFAIAHKVTSETLARWIAPYRSNNHTDSRLQRRPVAKPHQPLQPTIQPIIQPTIQSIIQPTIQSTSQPAVHLANASSPPNMKVSGLNHFNITASPQLIERVKQFYIEVVGLSIGPRAHLDHDGYWLYAGPFPILHLSAKSGMPEESSQNFFNHISLSCTGLAAAIAKLTAAGIPHRVLEIPDCEQTQIFMTDPAGLGVELTFFNESV